MFDLLEHVRDPLETLQFYKRILKPGGIITAVLPNTSSLSAKLMADNWAHYKKEHLFYFSPKTIIPLLKKISFKVFAIHPATKVMNFDYPYHQFRQYQHPLALPVMNFFHKILLDFFHSLSFAITMGEVFIVAEKGTKRYNMSWASNYSHSTSAAEYSGEKDSTRCTWST